MTAPADLKAVPRHVYYGVKPKPLLAKSLRNLAAARKKVREVAALFEDVDGTVEYTVDRETLPAIDELEQAVRDAVEYLNEPIEE